MTKLIKRSLLLLLVGAILLLAPNYIGEQGYVLISFAGWTAEGSVVSYAVVVIFAVIALMILWSLTKYVVALFFAPSNWWQKRSLQTHSNYFQSGLDFMALGMWQQAAEQLLKVKAVSKIQTAHELALVCATRANDAELLAKTKKAVNLSEDEIPVLTNLVDLVQQGQYEQALEQVKSLDVNWMKAELPLKQLWLDIQIQNFNWQTVNKHLPKLDKQVKKQNDEGIAQEWQTFLSISFGQGLKRFVQHHSVAQLQQEWQSWHKSNQQIPALSSAYISVLAEAKQLGHIEQLILDNWRQNKQQWLVDCLRTCYQEMKRVHMDKLFAQLQKAIKHDQENKTLLTAYAYLAAGQKDNQLAKQALEQVIYSNKNQIDTILYANVLAELGEVRHSVEVYQQMF
jgi:HemY protein